MLFKSKVFQKKQYKKIFQYLYLGSTKGVLKCIEVETYTPSHRRDRHPYQRLFLSHVATDRHSNGTKAYYIIN
jgi:hypothetical protein